MAIQTSTLMVTGSAHISGSLDIGGAAVTLIIDDDSMATAAQAAQDDSPPWRTLDDEGAFSPTPSMADRPLTGGGPSEDQSR